MRLLRLLILCPAVASASGFYLGENGTKALMQGGAFAGEADDLSAIQHNPAGLAQLKGFQFMVDGALMFHNVSFTRYDPGFDAANPPTSLANTVTNSGGPFPVPMIAAGFGFKLLDRNLTIALGVYGPPAVGKYQYPTPNYTKCTSELMMAGSAGEACNSSTDLGKYIENPRKFAPQRYTLVDNDILVIYPTLSLSYAIHPRFMLGLSLQPVVASFHFTQSVTSITRLGPPPTRQADEQPEFDSVVNVNLPLQLVNFTVVAGALVKPTDWLQLGASFRPQVMINAKGKLDIELGEAAKSLNTTVTGDETTLSLKLPAELKVGAHVRPFSKLGINADFVYMGWQSLSEIVVDPQNVSLKTGTDPATKVAPFRIQKNWVASYQVRLGASYSLFPWLSLHLGGWYETGSIPNDTIGVDFLHFGRANFTGGAGLHFGAFDIYLGAGGSPGTTVAVTQSKALAGSTEPDPAQVVGAGVYTSSSFYATLGIRGNFGRGADEKREPPPDETPKETPPIPAGTDPGAAPPAPAPAPAEAAPTEAPKS